MSLAQLYFAELETLQLSIHSDKKARVAGLQNTPEKDGPTWASESGYGGGKSDASRKGKGGKGDKSKGQGERQKVSKETKEACRQFSTDRGCPLAIPAHMDMTSLREWREGVSIVEV